MGGKGGSKGAPPEDDAEKSGGEGKWHWNQKYQVRRDSCAEFLFDPSFDRSAATKKDIKVKFKATSLFVATFGNTVIDGALGGKVEADDCTWCLSPDKMEVGAASDADQGGGQDRSLAGSAGVNQCAAAARVDRRPNSLFSQLASHLDSRTVPNRDISLYTRVGYSHSQQLCKTPSP